jgi:general secretion pathway protein N
VFQWRDWPPTPSVPHQAAPGDNSQPVGNKIDNPLDSLPPPVEKQDYVSVTERPIFLPGRRPQEESPESETDKDAGQAEIEPLPGLDTMDLNAVIITPKGAVAWVSTPSSPKPQRVQIGDDLQGWTVKAIATDEVEVQGNGSSDRLVLRNFSQGVMPTAPTPPHQATGTTGKVTTKINRPPRDAPRREQIQPKTKEAKPQHLPPPRGAPR